MVPPPAVGPDASESAARRRDLATALRNALRLGVSLVLTWAVALVVRFRLPRALGPEGFGALSFAEGFAGSFFVLAGLGLDTYIQKEVSARPGHASSFFGGALAVRLVAFGALSAALIGVLLGTGRGHLVPVAAVFALGQALAVTNASLAALLQAATTVGRLAVAQVVAKLVWGGGTLAVLMYTQSLWLVALPFALAEGLKAVALFSVVQRELGLTLRIDGPATRAVLAASVPYFVNTIAYSLGSKLDVAVLEFVAPPREVGFYGAASTLAMLALLLSPLVGWVLMPLLTRAQARSEEELYAIVRRGLEGVLVLAAPVSFTLAAFAPLWARVAFGQAFAPAARAIAVLAPSFLLTYTAVLLSTTLIIAGRPWAVTVVNLATTSVQPLLIATVVPWLGARGGEGAAGMANAAIVTTMELTTVTAFFALMGRRSLDGRLVGAVAKSVVTAAGALGAAVLVAGSPADLAALLSAPSAGAFRAVGAAVATYTVVAFGIGLVRPADARAMLRLVAEKRRGG